MLEKLKMVLASRRFYAAMIGAALVYINSQLKIVDDTAMATIVATISVWIIGESVRSSSIPNA